MREKRKAEKHWCSELFPVLLVGSERHSLLLPAIAYSTQNDNSTLPPTITVFTKVVCTALGQYNAAVALPREMSRAPDPVWPYQGTNASLVHGPLTTLTELSQSLNTTLLSTKIWTKRGRDDPAHSSTQIPEKARAVRLTEQCVSRTDCMTQTVHVMVLSLLCPGCRKRPDRLRLHTFQVNTPIL